MRASPILALALLPALAWAQSTAPIQAVPLLPASPGVHPQKPARQGSGGATQTGHAAAGHASSGHTPTGNVPTGNVASGNVPTGNVPTGNGSTSRAKTGHGTAARPVAGHAKAKPPAAAAAPAAPPSSPATPPAAAPPRIDPSKGTTTGLPLPRWASFRSDEVNLRSGPGMQYPIDWVYHRRDLPVQILREYEVWRLVETQDGTKGWVHQATLTGRRGFIVTDAEHLLRATADEAASAVARLEPGVVGVIRTCAAGQDWCQVQAGDYRGWLRRSDFWGSSPAEAIN